MSWLVRICYYDMDPPKRDEIWIHSCRMWVSAGQEAVLLPCRKLGVATPVSDPGHWVVAPPPAHLLLLSIMPDHEDQDQQSDEEVATANEDYDDDKSERRR